MKAPLGQFVPIPIAPIALLGALVGGRPNFMALGFISGANVSPPILSISINKRHYTIDGIVENRAFSVNFPSADYVGQTDYCGLVSGRDKDKAGIFYFSGLENAYRSQGECLGMAWRSGMELARPETPN